MARMNQQAGTMTPGGACIYMSVWISTASLPTWLWMEVGDRDNYNPKIMTDNIAY